MSKQFFIVQLYLFILVGNILFGQNAMSIDTKWISSKPEILTYRTTSQQGNGSYQVALVKSDSTIEIFIHMISPGFAKTISGFMTSDLTPLRQSGKIFIGDQVQMDNETNYHNGHLSIVTVVKPYNRTLKKDTVFTGRVFDPSQLPLLVRVIQLSKDAEFEYISLNPKNNSLYPIRMHVNGEESVQNIDCYKVTWKDFEGESLCWVEKINRHRIIRIEQSDSHRVTELIQ